MHTNRQRRYRYTRAPRWSRLLFGSMLKGIDFADTLKRAEREALGGVEQPIEPAARQRVGSR